MAAGADSRATYARKDVVDFYARSTGLLPPEQYLFGKYVVPGLDILDMGVGGGRTTPYLAPTARRYLGIDYAEEMVDACRAAFPDYEFRCGDATDLADIPPAAFDLAIFSFNGLDSLPGDAARRAALTELARVTRPGGHVIVSSHNAKQLVHWPLLAGASPLQKAWRIVRSIGKSAALARRTVGSGAYRAGSGYIDDPVHGGLILHASTPETIAADAATAGLRIVEHVGSAGATPVPAWRNAWTTYVLAKGEA